MTKNPPSPDNLRLFVHVLLGLMVCWGGRRGIEDRLTVEGNIEKVVEHSPVDTC